MGDTPFYRRPWFYIAGWLVILLIAYFWDIFSLGGIRINEVRIFFDLACLFPLLLILWMAFFSQFILPVHTFSDRLQIFNRLIARLFGSRGPAIFIKNGIEEKEPGEEKRKGPGVLWLDSASAAVTRTATKIKQTLGPGVHFIDAKETIAGTVDLHRQWHSIGPREEEDPFADKTEENYRHIQDRRKQVSALTRDGIEVVPNINIVFRVNTGFPREDQPGSRFGYRTGVTSKDKMNENEDKEVIRNAILGEGVNPYYGAESPRRRMAWNQLPTALAVDVWREYASKFTLEELFTPGQEVPPPPPPKMEPSEEEVASLTQGTYEKASRDLLQTILTNILSALNGWMSRQIAKLEKKNTSEPLTGKSPQAPPSTASKEKTEPKTAFELINEMVKARLTQPVVDHLDATGKRVEIHPKVYLQDPSPEFYLLKKRGLKVLSVSISNPRLNPEVDKVRIGKWEANWVANTNLEKEQNQRTRTLFEEEGQEEAVKKYATWLSQTVLSDNPENFKQALKSLLKRTRSIIIRNDEFRRRMSTESRDVDEILRWMEINGQ